MTDFAKKLQTLPEHVQLAIRKGRGISYSRAKTWHTCQLQGKFQYVDKLPHPSTDEMRHGTMFDTWTEPHDGLMAICPCSMADQIVLNRAREYMDMIDKLRFETVPELLTRWTQYPLYAALPDDHWFYGWADDLFLKDGKVIALEDRKFSKEPWNDNKYKYYDKQAQCYIWALRQMGIAVSGMTFRVGNLATPGIQSFTYKPQQKSLAGIPDWLMEAVRMPSGLIAPKGGRHCEFCAFTRNCDDFLWPTP